MLVTNFEAASIDFENRNIVLCTIDSIITSVKREMDPDFQGRRTWTKKFVQSKNLDPTIYFYCMLYIIH